MKKSNHVNRTHMVLDTNYFNVRNWLHKYIGKKNLNEATVLPTGYYEADGGESIVYKLITPQEYFSLNEPIRLFIPSPDVKLQNLIVKFLQLNYFKHNLDKSDVTNLIWSIRKQFKNANYPFPLSDLQVKDIKNKAWEIYNNSQKHMNSQDLGELLKELGYMMTRTYISQSKMHYHGTLILSAVSKEKSHFNDELIRQGIHNMMSEGEFINNDTIKKYLIVSGLRQIKKVSKIMREDIRQYNKALFGHLQYSAYLRNKKVPLIND